MKSTVKEIQIWQIQTRKGIAQLVTDVGLIQLPLQSAGLLYWKYNAREVKAMQCHVLSPK